MSLCSSRHSMRNHLSLHSYNFIVTFVMLGSDGPRVHFSHHACMLWHHTCMYGKIVIFSALFLEKFPKTLIRTLKYLKHFLCKRFYNHIRNISLQSNILQFVSHSLSKWYLTITCFFFPCWTRFCAMDIADVLSHLMIFSPLCSSPKSCIHILNHIHWLTTTEQAMYNA